MTDKLAMLATKLDKWTRELLTQHTDQPSDALLEMAFRQLYENHTVDFAVIVDEINRRHTAVIIGGDIPLWAPPTVRYQGKRRTISAELLPFDDLGLGNGRRSDGSLKRPDWWGVLSRITPEDQANRLAEALDKRDIALGLLTEDGSEPCPTPTASQ